MDISGGIGKPTITWVVTGLEFDYNRVPLGLFLYIYLCSYCTILLTD